MNRNLIVTAACLVSFAAGNAYAADIEAGKKKAGEVCAVCHGADGNSTSSAYPKLAGQHADYIVKALSDYKSGARKDPMMGGMAAPLSPQDVENVAAYFASQKGLTQKY